MLFSFSLRRPSYLMRPRNACRQLRPTRRPACWPKQRFLDGPTHAAGVRWQNRSKPLRTRLCKRVIHLRVPDAVQREAKRNGAPPSRDRSGLRVRNGPGSAAHHFALSRCVLRCSRDTAGVRWQNRSKPLSPFDVSQRAPSAAGRLFRTNEAPLSWTTAKCVPLLCSESRWPPLCCRRSQAFLMWKVHGAWTTAKGGDAANLQPSKHVALTPAVRPSFAVSIGVIRLIGQDSPRRGQEAAGDSVMNSSLNVGREQIMRQR
jgi:hypothetical protein